ncbi:MAG: hypothetical protein AB1453_02770 [Chloroflexota bacterium]
MYNNTSKNGISQFQDMDQESGRVLALWLERSGVERKTILNEICVANTDLGEIGEKTFRQWTSYNESSHRVSGTTLEIRGSRLVALVRWFFREHTHRARPVMYTGELRSLIMIYRDLPIKNRLQLKRLLHDLEIHNGEREANFLFASDWKSRFAEWPVFCFVLDRYWTVRASTCYEMALAGYREEDMTHWSWWHRLMASRGGKPKFMPESPRYSLRGPYADIYYCQQIERFQALTEPLREIGDLRYKTLMELLKLTPRFNEMWDKVNCPADLTNGHSIGIPVPFFRQDNTLLWMLEVSTIIPNTPDYQLIVWVPLNEDSAEYQAEIRRWADESGYYSRKAYFIEEFAHYFGEKECQALGVEANP